MLLLLLLFKLYYNLDLGFLFKKSPNIPQSKTENHYSPIMHNDLIFLFNSQTNCLIPKIF